MKRLAVILTLAIALCNGNAFAFNLWKDLQQNTDWTLGENAAVGTAFALVDSDGLGIKAGQYVPSFLAQITQYRFLSGWWGGTQIKQPDGTQKLFDTAKLGFNVAYIFTGFVHQPPDLIKRLVVGPSLCVNMFSTPHVVVPFFDINYQFGRTATNTPPAEVTVRAPTVSRLSKLNLFNTSIAG